MSQDAPPTAAIQTGDGVIARRVRRKHCIYTALPGAIVGMFIGLLNLAAAKLDWKIQRDFFDIVNAPIYSRIASQYYLMGPPSLSTTAIRDSYSVYVLLICYWAIIGLFLASLVCLVRTGVVRDIMRDKTCGYSLFFGACCGISIGSLSFLAASNGWDVLSKFFDSFNQPVYSVMDALQERYNLLSSDMRTQIILWGMGAAIYWMLICLFPAFVYCVIRILVKRKAAGGAVAPEE
jgi:hypothetical protein